MPGSQSGRVVSDGFTSDGFTVVGNPRLVILRGTTFVREVRIPPVPTHTTA